MVLQNYKSREKLLKHKSMIIQIGLLNEDSKKRLLETTRQEVNIIIFVVKNIMLGRIELTKTVFKIVSRLSKFRQLKLLFNQNQLHTLHDKTVLLKYLKVLGILFECLI